MPMIGTRRNFLASVQMASQINGVAMTQEGRRPKTRLALLRDRSGMRQEDMADALGMTTSGYRKYEYGWPMPIARARTAASIFGVPVDYLLSDLDGTEAIQTAPAPQPSVTPGDPTAAEVAEAVQALLRVSPAARPFVLALVEKLEQQDSLRRPE